jgi:exopolysaccharide biosynthesis protein
MFEVSICKLRRFSAYICCTFSNLSRYVSFRAAAYFLLIISVAYSDDSFSSSIEWQKINDDIAISTESAFWPSLLSPNVLLFRPNLYKYRIRVRTAREFGKSVSSAQEISRKSGGLFVINGSFFDHLERPLGLVISRGITISPLHKGGTTLTGIFQIRNGRPEIIHRDNFNPSGVVEAIQAGPRLLVEGKATPVTKDNSRSLRTAVCLDQASNILFASSTRWVMGVTLQEMQNILKRVGCRNALNLDGGGSAQFVFAPTSISNRIELLGKDQVPVFLEILRK